VGCFTSIILQEHEKKSRYGGIGNRPAPVWVGIFGSFFEEVRLYASSNYLMLACESRR